MLQLAAGVLIMRGLAGFIGGAGSDLAASTMRLVIGSALLYQGETIAIKRLENLPEDMVRAISDNKPEYPPYTVMLREIRIIGQVIWFARELAPRA